MALIDHINDFLLRDIRPVRFLFDAEQSQYCVGGQIDQPGKGGKELCQEKYGRDAQISPSLRSPGSHLLRQKHAYCKGYV